MSNPTAPNIASLTQTLKDFEHTLIEEQNALKDLDYGSIDRSTKRKLDLQSQLEFQLHSHREDLQHLQAEQVQALKSALEQCRGLAKRNDAMIVAYQKHIKSLQERLSGSERKGYGPKRRFMAAPTSSQAVLTDSIG